MHGAPALALCLLAGCDVVWDTPHREPPFADAKFADTTPIDHDEDSDSYPDVVDKCPMDVDGQADSDGDEVGDVCDARQGLVDQQLLFTGFGSEDDLAIWPSFDTWRIVGDAAHLPGTQGAMYSQVAGTGLRVVADLESIRFTDGYAYVFIGSLKSDQTPGTGIRCMIRRSLSQDELVVESATSASSVPLFADGPFRLRVSQSGRCEVVIQGQTEALMLANPEVGGTVLVIGAANSSLAVAAVTAYAEP